MGQLEISKSQTKKLGYFTIIAIVLAFFIFSSGDDTAVNDHTTFFSTYDGKSRLVVNAVKSKLNNPDSFEHVSTTNFTNEYYDHYIVKMTYRATNGFNAVITNTALCNLYFDGRVEILELE